MAEVITRFKLETTQFNSKLRDTSKELSSMVKEAQKTGKGFGDMSSKALESARSLGTVSSGATTTRDKVRDLVGAYNDAAKAFNSLTEEQKKGEFGRALSTSLTQLSSRIREAKDELYGLGDAMEKKNVGGLFSSDKISGMLQVFGGNLMTKAAGMAASFVGELGEAVKQGAELARQGEGIRHAFERLGRGDLLQGLREATHGTVTDIELMKAAVKFNDFKLPVEELGTKLAFAQQKAKDTGQSVDYMVDSIVTGLGRKSLLILDNLGLSAAEIKDRMKDTGDMTKAVGEIIREQMSKAGDYVETAADRATKANVDLQNAMENLGRTFQPLTDAGTSMWNSLKIGALDLLNSAVKPLIDALTEAGRIRAQYEKQGGNTRVNRMLGNLKGIHSSQYRQNTYNAQIGNFDKSINEYQQYLDDYQKWEKGKQTGNIEVGAHDRMEAFKKNHKLDDYTFSTVKEQLAVFKRERAEYVMGAKSILNDMPAPSPTENGTTTTGGGRTTGVNTQKMPTAEDFTSFIGKASFGVEKMKPENILGPSDTWKEYGESIAESMNGVTDSFSNLTEWTLDFDPYTEKMKEMTIAAKQQRMAFNMAGQAAQNFAGALASLDDPAAKAAGTVISAIANIALGFGQAVASAGEMGPWAWLAYVAAGTSALATTISTVHSLTGYANGGRVEGNSYSGDNIPIMANAGEIVLNQAQQSNVAAGLQGAAGAMGNMRLRSEVRGSNLVLVIDRALKEQGSELAVWGR